MKNIYIILSQTGTTISKLLKVFSHKEYNHASISFDKSLNEFYSFGRKKVNNFLNGGFVIEHKNKGVYKKWSNTPCIIVEKEVTDNQYEILQSIIKNEFVAKKDQHKYDFWGVPFVNTPINIHSSNKYFCSSFIATILNKVDIKTVETPNHMEPIDFLKLKNSRIIYKGILQEYH